MKKNTRKYEYAFVEEDFPAPKDNKKQKLVKKEELDREHRRLISLARLVQGRSLCAAVYFDDNIFNIATNDIYLSSHSTNKAIELINSVMDDFLGEKIKYSVFEGLSLENIFGECRTFLKTLKDEEFKCAARECFEEALKIMKSKSEEAGGKRLKFGKTWFLEPEKKILDAMDNCTTQKQKEIGVIMPMLARLAKDYFKVEKYIKSLKKNVKYKICRLESKDVHAEMRLLSYLISSNKLGDGQKIKIGISKKCCPDCADVFIAMNQALSDKKLPKLSLCLGEDEYIEDEHIEDEKKISFGNKHKLQVKKWTCPDFLLDDFKCHETYQEILNLTRQNYKILKEEREKSSEKEDMDHHNSQSSPEMSDEEERHTGMFNDAAQIISEKQATKLPTTNTSSPSKS